MTLDFLESLLQPLRLEWDSLATNGNMLDIGDLFLLHILICLCHLILQFRLLSFEVLLCFLRRLHLQIGAAESDKCVKLGDLLLVNYCLD